MPDARARGIAAEQLLENETFRHLLAALEQDAVEALAVADLADHDALQRAAADLQAARRFRAAAQSLVTTGRNADRVAPAVA